MKKGIFVGEFNRDDIIADRDTKALVKVQEETGLKYCNHEFIKKRGKIVGMRLWACSREDCEDFV